MSEFVATPIASGPAVDAPGFVAGFAARQAGADAAIARVLNPLDGFTESAPGRPALVAEPEPELIAEPKSFSPQPAPKHFSPADPDSNPTEGWDPLDAARALQTSVEALADARTAGFADGYAAAKAEGARDLALLTTLAESLASIDRFDRDAMADRLRGTVLFLVTKLVGEVGVSAELLAERVNAAAGMLADASESALLRVNPADVALLEGQLPQTIFAVGDPHVERGAFVLESASTVVEDGPRLWLDQLARAVDQVALPAC